MSSSRFDVLSIGNAIVDVLARVDERFLTKHQLAKGMMRLIDEATAEELFADMGPATVISGGSAGNTAAGIASFGGRSAYFGKIKQDQMGELFGHDLRAQGVHFDSARAVDGPATARSFILVTPDGERTMNTYLGACVNLTVADIMPEIVARFRRYLYGRLSLGPAGSEGSLRQGGGDRAQGGAKDGDHTFGFFLRRPASRELPRSHPEPDRHRLCERDGDYVALSDARFQHRARACGG